MVPFDKHQGKLMLTINSYHAKEANSRDFML